MALLRYCLFSFSNCPAECEMLPFLFGSEETNSESLNSFATVSRNWQNMDSSPGRGDSTALALTATRPFEDSRFCIYSFSPAKEIS